MVFPQPMLIILLWYFQGLSLKGKPSRCFIQIDKPVGITFLKTETPSQICREDPLRALS